MREQMWTKSLDFGKNCDENVYSLRTNALIVKQRDPLRVLAHVLERSGTERAQRTRLAAGGVAFSGAALLVPGLVQCLLVLRGISGHAIFAPQQGLPSGENEAFP